MWPSILSNCLRVRQDFSASYNSSLSSLERANSSGSFSSWRRRRATFCVAIAAERFNCSTPFRFALGIKSSMGPSLRTAHPPYIDDAPDARIYKISSVRSREREDELAEAVTKMKQTKIETGYSCCTASNSYCQAQRTPRRTILFNIATNRGVGRFQKRGSLRERRTGVFEHRQAFATHIDGEISSPRHVPAWSSQTIREFLAYGIGDDNEHHWDCRGGLLSRLGRHGGYSHKNIYFGCDKFGRQWGVVLVLLGRVAIF